METFVLSGKNHTFADYHYSYGVRALPEPALLQSGKVKRQEIYFSSELHRTVPG